MREVIKRVGISFVVVCILSFLALIIALVLTKEHEQRLNEQDSELIDLYHGDSSEDTVSIDDNGNDKGTNEQVVYSAGDIDCVLYLDSIGVVLPVMKGNTERDLSLFRTVVANNDMVLGETIYSIMGHHARDMNVSLGGLNYVQVGDRVRIEQNGVFYEYNVASSVVQPAEECSYLFRAKTGNLVYLFTCDYTLGKEDLIYRIVTCKPVT